MIITHKLEMDLVRPDALPRMDVVQGDANSRVLELTMLSDGRSWPVPEGTRVELRYRKSDGTGGRYDTLPDGTKAWSVEGNILRMTLAPQVLTAPGIVLAQLELSLSDAVAATFTMQICVHENPAAGAVESEDYVNMLRWMEAELDRYLLEAKESGAFDGPQGIPGPSVYERAQAYGYAGTEAELMEQLLEPCLPVAGGTMQGSVFMDGQRITGLGDPVDTGDAVSKGYLDQRKIVKFVLLSPGGWSASAPHTLEMVVSGLRSQDLPRVVLAYGENEEINRQNIQQFSRVSYWQANQNKIRFVCLDEKPTAELPLYIEVQH